MSERSGATKETQSWRQLYEAALIESQGEKLFDRIVEAQSAIARRALALTRENASSDAEKDALVNAQAIMNVLQRSHQSEQRSSAGRAA